MNIKYYIEFIMLMMGLPCIINSYDYLFSMFYGHVPLKLAGHLNR